MSSEVENSEKGTELTYSQRAVLGSAALTFVVAVGVIAYMSSPLVILFYVVYLLFISFPIALTYSLTRYSEKKSLDSGDYMNTIIDKQESNKKLLESWDQQYEKLITDP